MSFYQTLQQATARSVSICSTPPLSKPVAVAISAVTPISPFWRRLTTTCATQFHS